MIEMVGVLAITGLLTAGAFVLIRSGMSSQKRRRATDEINTLAQSVRMLTAEAENFGNLPSLSAIATNGQGPKLARALLKTNGTTPFGDNTYYVVTQGDTLDRFRIGMINLESEDCYLLSVQTWADAQDTSCDGGNLSVYFGK